MKRRSRHEETRRTVIVAGLANILVGLVKLVAGVLSGSSAMLAEAAHSAADTLAVALTFSGLTSPVTTPPGVPGPAHIHFGDAGVSGPILFPFLNSPTGVESGSFSTTLTALTLPLTRGLTLLMVPSICASSVSSKWRE